MTNYDDYRFQSHHILLELDAATTALMMLVSGRQTEGPRWCGAVERHKLAYETWAAFLLTPCLFSMGERQVSTGHLRNDPLHRY